MWIMTTRGFYSAVQKKEDVASGMVTVRARSKADIEALADLLPNGVVPYQERFASDYPWRFRVTAAQWAGIVASLALDIDYSNFKDRVKSMNPGRAGLYSRLWSILLGIESEKGAKPRRSPLSKGAGQRW